MTLVSVLQKSPSTNLPHVYSVNEATVVEISATYTAKKRLYRLLMMLDNYTPTRASEINKIKSTHIYQCFLKEKVCLTRHTKPAQTLVHPPVFHAVKYPFNSSYPNYPMFLLDIYVQLLFQMEHHF